MDSNTNLISKFKEYLKVEKGYSFHTTIAYENDLLSFQEFIKSLEQDIKIEEIEYSHIRQWIITLIEKGIENKSINRKISTLKTFYKFLLKVDVLKNNPLEQHKSLKTPKKVLVPFSQKEMNSIEDFFDENSDFEKKRNFLIIEMLYATGIRRAELITLKLNDLFFDQKLVKVLGKRNKERLIPLLDNTILLLKDYIELRKEINTQTNHLFITQKGNKIYENLVYRIVKEYMNLVSSKEIKSPHVLRHAFATHLIDEGADLNTVKELLGHATLASTQVYINTSLERIKEIYRKTHPRNQK